MSYCQPGEKVTINYNFNGVKQPKIEAIGAIEVTSGKDDDNNPNYNPTGYQISFYSPNNYQTIRAIVIDYEVTDTGNGGDYKYSMRTQGCDGKWSGTVNVHINTIVIDYSIHCPVPLPNSGNCFIKIFKNGKQISKIVGLCPANFIVTCGDDCPEGQEKIIISEYPGYCCLDCSSLAGEVRSIRNIVKNL